MLWNQWYSLKSYVRSSLWIVPFVAVLLYLVAIRVVGMIDTALGWQPEWFLGEAGPRVIVQTILNLALTFLIFILGSLLVAIQVAGGQLTPRIIASTLLSNNALRIIIGLLIFTFLFAMGTSARLEAGPAHLTALIAGLLGLVSLAAFLFLIDYAARMLRPVSVLWLVGEKGRAAIREVYPHRLEAGEAPPRAPAALSSPRQVVTHAGHSAILLAINLKAIVALARQADAVIELVPMIGDFVGADEALFRVFGGKGAIDERLLRGTVAFGPERTIDQDSTFSFRIVVDIAIKALSAAINDPTTAVLAIDQLQRLLRAVGLRQLHNDQVFGPGGALRVIARTPNWEDFVHLTFAEIRLYGASNFQISRRLRAMIESLIEILPPARHPALRHELDLLDRALVKLHDFPEDLAIARLSDPQGLGGRSPSPTANGK
ncbi:DUF2254 domain-containing protein [Dongia sp.]|uniref:DUF2254 domain-containing protein n=1 Tax=Dongia sp. TaxID=1977262 RepID=UPI00374FFA56